MARGATNRYRRSRQTKKKRGATSEWRCDGGGVGLLTWKKKKKAQIEVASGVVSGRVFKYNNASKKRDTEREREKEGDWKRVGPQSPSAASVRKQLTAVCH